MDECEILSFNEAYSLQAIVFASPKKKKKSLALVVHLFIILQEKKLTLK